MFDALENSPRLLIETTLRPVQGDRFQPTGFADLGAATYRTADGVRKLLVESAQSVANRLEATILGPDNELIEELEGLSYVRVKLNGPSDAVTNSLIEAHRMNSPFIISDKEFQRIFVEEAGYKRGTSVNWRKVARAIYKYDVNSLLHGIFLANVEDGRIRLARAVTGFVEATDVLEAVSGGVKNNPLDPTGKLRAVGYDKDVYGNVPYTRVEYTAAQITGFFNLDLRLLRSYDLGHDAWQLLVALALLKIRRFLDNGMRLRTACDLELDGGPSVTSPSRFQIPTEAELLSRAQEGIRATASMFADPPVTEFVTKVTDKKSKTTSSEREA